MPSFIKSDTHITIVFDDSFETVTVHSAAPLFDSILQAIKDCDWQKVKELTIPREAIASNELAKEGLVTIRGDRVFYKDQAMHGTLIERMIGMLREGFNISPMIQFLNNLMDNPSNTAVTELYDFLEEGDLPITEDGCFLAYKRVKGNYADIYTGTISNAIGAVVSMPRNKVDDNRDETCSHGLHFCSRGYLPSYGAEDGNRTIVIKINPADVVSIPADYNNTKGRCCKYVVVGELEHKSEIHLEGNFNKDYSSMNDHDEDYGTNLVDGDEEGDSEINVIGITEDSLGG